MYQVGEIIDGWVFTRTQGWPAHILLVRREDRCHLIDGAAQWGGGNFSGLSYLISSVSTAQSPHKMTVTGHRNTSYQWICGDADDVCVFWLNVGHRRHRGSSACMMLQPHDVAAVPSPDSCMCAFAATAALSLFSSLRPRDASVEVPAARTSSADRKTRGGGGGGEAENRAQEGRGAAKAGRGGTEVKDHSYRAQPFPGSLPEGPSPTHTMAGQPIRALASLTRPPSYNCSSMAQRSRCEVMRVREEEAGVDLCA